MAFIPNNKFKKLREDSKNGNEIASKILKLYLNGGDYSADIEEYFKPKEEIKEVKKEDVPNPENNAGDGLTTNLKEWLKANNIGENDFEYQEAISEYYEEYPEEKPKEEVKEEIKEEPKEEEVKEEAKEEAKEEPAHPDLVVEDVVKGEEGNDGKEEYKSLAQDFINLISKCDAAYLKVMQDEEIEDNAQKGMLATIEEIKRSLLESVDKVKKLKSILNKEEEKEQEKEQETNVVEEKPLETENL